MGFHEDDIGYAKSLVVSGSLLVVKKEPLTTNNKQQTVLCLHAGNLPLVGWHDVVSVCRAGCEYVGKLSKKDPHLGEWIREWMPEARISTDLDDFAGLRADAVLFSGSSDSVSIVLKRLKEIHAIHDKTRYLIRTAHTSMAWVDSLDVVTMMDLAEGIARYDGQGCRSVRYVYSPFPFSEAKNALLAASEGFSDRELFARNLYRSAYLKSIGKEVVKVGKLIVTDSDPLWDDDDLVVWKQESREEMLSHSERLGSGLQQLYHTKEIIEGGRWEPLSQAQKPPLDWRPDGVDVVSWLKEN